LRLPNNRSNVLLPAFASPQTAGPAEAMALEQQGKLPEAVEAWRAVTGHNPQDAGALASLGVALAQETSSFGNGRGEIRFRGNSRASECLVSSPWDA